MWTWPRASTDCMTVKGVEWEDQNCNWAQFQRKVQNLTKRETGAKVIGLLHLYNRQLVKFWHIHIVNRKNLVQKHDSKLDRNLITDQLYVKLQNAETFSCFLPYCDYFQWSGFCSHVNMSKHTHTKRHTHALTHKMLRETSVELFPHSGSARKM